MEWLQPGKYTLTHIYTTKNAQRHGQGIVQSVQKPIYYPDAQ